MKKIIPLLFTIAILFYVAIASGQMLNVECYHQNATISPNAVNYIYNGSFENTTCDPYPVSERFCPNSTLYSCDIAGWTSTGGGTDTYAHMYDNNIIVIPDGTLAPYFGNSFPFFCPSGDTLCFSQSGCEMILPAGYPMHSSNYGGLNGVSLEQTYALPAAGDTFVVEFWAGGEPQLHGMYDPGVFAVNVGFGNIFLRNYPTGLTDTGIVYIISFISASTSPTLSFTNWGHPCTTCTELVIDNVKVYPISDLFGRPTADFISYSTGYICPGGCVTFNGHSTNATSYQWYFPGSSTPSSTLEDPGSICYPSPGNYDVTFIAFGNGHSDTLSSSNVVHVYPQPPAQQIIQSGDTLFGMQGCDSYQWYFDGNIIPGATDYIYVASADGDYSIVCTDTNGCESEAVIYDVVTDLFYKPVETNTPVLYSDPANNLISLKIPGLQESDTYNIYNITGEKISGGKITSSETNINIETLPAGLYFLQLDGKENHYQFKFVRQ